MVTRLRGKGKITIPDHIRKALKLRENSILSIVKIGDAIILAPPKSLHDGISKKVVKASKKESISLNDLLKDLKKQRKPKD